MSEVTGLCAGHQNLGKPKIFALFASEEVGGALSFTKLFFFFSLLIWSERLFTQLRHTDKLGERKSISTTALGQLLWAMGQAHYSSPEDSLSNV
jgi:hypothetical protein